MSGGTVSAEARRVMGDLQHFCLRWNNYQNSITTAFENLRDDEDFIDVTLACDGKSLKAHRVVLSACSPYFRELLKSTPCKHPVIVLQDVVFDDLQALVEFIYHGEVNVHQRNLSSFLKTAEVLRVSGLTQPSDSASNDHSARQSSETPPAENSFLSLAAQAVEGRVSPQVRQRKGFPQQSPSSIPSPRSKENSPIPLNKRNNKTLSGGSNGGGGGGNGGGGGGGGGGMDLSERTSQHSPGSAGSRPNCMDDEDSGERSDGGSGGGGGGGGGGGNGNGLNMMHDEPPMDYSRTHQLHAVAAVLHQQQQQQQQQDTAQNLMVPRRSSPAEVKSEPMDTASSAAPLNNSGGGGAYGADDCSNDSAADFTGVHPAVGMSEPDDTSYQSHHSYLDSKFFAAAGAATFNFSMAAAMAADSLAGLNNHNHTNVMEALGGSSSQDWSEAGGGVGVGGAETLSCFVCGKRLSTRLTLKRHIEQQHNQPLHSAVCNVCNKVFRTLNSLNNHKSIYHRKPKAYKSTAGGGTVVASAAAAAVAAAGLVPPASSPDGTGDGSAAATAPKNLPPLTVWYKNNNNNHNNNNNGNGN